jgi:SAM-dependent methyltransferase
MNFERPNFNNEFSKSEQEPMDPNFLQKQVRLPKYQWNEKFRQLIEERTRENQQVQESIKEEEIVESPEVLQERTFKRYMEGLGLSEESLRGKKVLDLGSGEGEFVKFLIDKGITSQVYGIDVELDENIIENRFKKHFIRGSFEEDLPVQNVDYIVSVGAVSNGIWGGKEVMNIRRIVEKSLASLKENGEIRIYPIQEAAEETPLEGLRASQEKWKELLTEISEVQKVECKIEPRNIKVCGKNNDVILESVLVIRRKKN